ncbi:MAG TPA: transporter [Candidatus Paceibacterota bacterium]|nr:transporter [Verrucomicrobiota bacterium]HRY49256.1 transporter [Candidatus Paceibacterota bacterium]
MKPNVLFFTTIAASALLAGAVQAQPVASHYPVGVEGIKGASLPPPGLYARDYNIFYTANDFPDGPAHFDAFVYVNAPRLIWMSPWKILGATYGADVIVPFGYSDLKIEGQKFSTFGLGDIQVEPLLLSWNRDRYDIAFGYAVWAPTGDFDRNDPSCQGAGFWSHMLTLGGTLFFDAEKTWALSLLNRYEFNHENDDIDITPGQVYTLEWGLSKSLKKTIDVGVIGYYQQQTTDDSGSGAVYDRSVHDRVFGIGPEISLFCPKLGLFTALRYNYEFSAEQRPEGHRIALTFTYRF